MRVDFERLRDGFLGGLVFLAIDQVIRQQEMARRVVGVARHRGFERKNHQPPIAGRIRLGEAEMEIRIVRKLLQALVETLRCEIVIVLVERELAAGEVRLAIGRIATLGEVEELFQNAARIHAEDERRLAHRD